MAAINLLFANNAQTTIANSIGPTAVAVNLSAGQGALFPNPDPVANEYFVGTFTDAATGLIREIVWVTQRVGDTLTIVRGREGTSGLSWTANDLFAELWTAGQAEALVQVPAAQAQSFNVGEDTGSTNAYVCALDPVVPVAPGNGFPVRLLADNTNTGASTLDAGWGAVAVRRRDGSALIGGEIVAGHITDLLYNADTGQFEVGPGPATSAAVNAGTDQQSYITPQQLAGASLLFTGALAWAAVVGAAPTGWYECYGQDVNRVTDSALFAAITRSATVTMTIAAPCVVTWANHGLYDGDVISFETSGALPTGLSTATNYYVRRINANTFNVCTSPANVVAGTYITTTGSQSGVQTCRNNPFGCGDGSTTFTLPDGRDVALAGNTYMGGTARNLLNNNTSVGGFATAAMGNMAGAKDHEQVEGEVGEHDHAPSDGSNGNDPVSLTGSVSPSQFDGGSSNFYPVTRTGINQAQAGVDPMNITQPTLLVRLFIKR